MQGFCLSFENMHSKAEKPRKWELFMKRFINVLFSVYQCLACCTCVLHVYARSLRKSEDDSRTL